MRSQEGDIGCIGVLQVFSVEGRRFPALRLAHSFGPHLGTCIARGGWRSRMAEDAVRKEAQKPATSTPTLWGDTGELPKGMLVPVAARAASQ